MPLGKSRHKFKVPIARRAQNTQHHHYRIVRNGDFNLRNLVSDCQLKKQFRQRIETMTDCRM